MKIFWQQLVLGYFLLEFINCDIHCEEPPKVPHGTVTGIKSGVYYLPYDEVEIRCKPGYKYNGPMEFVMCEEDGNWEEAFGVCVEIFCDPPEPPANGTIPQLQTSNLALFPYNFQITYECTQGYRLFGGDSWRFCDKNGWSGKTPYCKEIRCPDPSVPEHGDREGDNLQVGSKVRFRCFTGYELLGSFERFCMPNGQWTGELTRCNDPGNHCPNPGIPINGFKNGDSCDIGDKVTYRCQPGYILLGSDVRECLLNRTWSGTEVKCMAPYDFDNHAQMGEMLKLKVSKKFDDKKREREFYPQIHSVHKVPMQGPETSESTIDRIVKTHDENFELLLLQEKVASDQSLRLPDNFEAFPFQTELSIKSIETNYDTLHRRIDVSYQRRLILHFAFDVSGSIGPYYLQESIKFAKAIVKKVGISRDGSRASAVVFSSKAEIKFYPMQFETEEKVLANLDAIEFTGGGTSASSALALINSIIEHEESYSSFGRNDKEDVIFIITDGKINMGGNPEKEAKAMIERNIDIYCIGITGDPRIETLYKIASKSQYGDKERENVFILEKYSTLSHLIQEITNGTSDFSECGLGLENIVSKNEGTTQTNERKEPWPWMAALYFLRPGYSQSFQLQCGGTIVKEKFILTAAHCLYLKDNREKVLRLWEKEHIMVKIGLFNLNDETQVQEFSIRRIFIHENYRPGNYSVQEYDYDIALLELDRDIEYDQHVRPICLPPKDLQENGPLYSPNEFGWAGGWGYGGILGRHTRNMQLINSRSLKELRLPIQSHERCIKSLEVGNVSQTYFTDRMFCAGTGKSGNDTCLGDSGGPLMQPQMNSDGFLYWTQVGIVSWGVGCGLEDMYGYYTHVKNLRPWIDEKINFV